MQEKIQYLTEIERTDKIDNNGNYFYKYKCICNKEILCIKNRVTQKNKTHCGCLRLSKLPSIGQQYFNLTVIGIREFKNNRNQTIINIICRCICNKVIEVKLFNLNRKKIKNCGCLNKRKKIKHILSGDKFGKLTYIESTDKRSKEGNKISLYRCDCGTLVEFQDSNIRKKSIKSCGCSRIKTKVGDVFGRLTVIKVEVEKYNTKSKKKHKIYCLCKCGNVCTVRRTSLVSGATISCGCYAKEIHMTAKVFRKRSGKGHHKWNENLTDEKRAQINQRLSFSKNIFKRDNYVCQKCKKVGEKLHAHHLDGYHWCIEKRNDIDNGITLCKTCHHKFHSIYTTKNNTRQQFEEFMELKECQ